MKTSDELIKALESGDSVTDFSGSAGVTVPVNISPYENFLTSIGFSPTNYSKDTGAHTYEIEKKPYSYAVVIRTPNNGFQYSHGIQWEILKSGTYPVSMGSVPFANGTGLEKLKLLVTKALQSTADNEVFGKDWYGSVENMTDQNYGTRPVEDVKPADKLLTGLDSIHKGSL